MRASVIIVAVVLAACRATGQPTAEPITDSDPAALAHQLTRQLERAARDWNQGDLDGFLSDYAPESTTTYVDGRRARQGMDFIRKHYSPRFSPGARRDSLRFEETQVRPFSPTLALVTSRFILEQGSEVTASGPFTLVMELRPEGWKILHDHTSSDPR